MSLDRHGSNFLGTPRSHFLGFYVGEEVVLLVIGFLLTSVAGGFLTYLFQKRRWNADQRESERRSAGDVFAEVSRLMDRRLYRMWILHWTITGRRDDDASEALTWYRAVLDEWNENLNRNLALVHRYFGEAAWSYLDRVLYEEFVRLGKELERRYKEEQGSKSRNQLRFEDELKALSDDVYNFDGFMVSLIQRGQIGIYQRPSEAARHRVPWQSELDVGSRGPQVAAWQKHLNYVTPGLQLVVDGRFGRATQAATKSFQQSRGLDVTGVVTDSTRAEMQPLLAGRSPSW